MHIAVTPCVCKHARYIRLDGVQQLALVATRKCPTTRLPPGNIPRKYTPEIYPGNRPRKYTPEICPGNVPRKYTPDIYPGNISRKYTPEIYRGNIPRKYTPEIYPGNHASNLAICNFQPGLSYFMDIVPAWPRNILGYVRSYPGIIHWK
jgi:hypothetical protein